MFFESMEFYVELVENMDVNEVVEVYNSNKDFLVSHMDMDRVTDEWILQELESMKNIGFHSYKIVDISTRKIIGVIDFKMGEETYLSLLIVHNDYKNKGLGKLIFKAFEEYVISQKSKSIKIDVVTNYDTSVLDFWINNGFIKLNTIELNWTGKILPAITMKKIL